MSLGEILFILLLGLAAFDAMAFVIFMGILILDALTDLLRRAGVPLTMSDAIATVIVACFLAFFIWFIFLFPAPAYWPLGGEQTYYEQPREMRD